MHPLVRPSSGARAGRRCSGSARSRSRPRPPASAGRSPLPPGEPRESPRPEHTSPMSDLFADAARERSAGHAPLAQRFAPRTLDELVGQQHVLGRARRCAARSRTIDSLADPLRPAGSRQDDARADRRRDDRRGLRGALGGLGSRRRRPPRAPGRSRPPRRQRAADDPLPRRDPSLQQGPAGRAPALGRGRPPDADRRDDREPVLRGQLRAALPLPGGRAGGARRGGAAEVVRRGAQALERRGAGRRGADDRAPRGRRRSHRPQHGRARLGDSGRRGRPARRASRRRRRPQAAAPLRQGRRPALRLRLRLHQVDARLRSGRRRLLPRGDARRRRGSALHRRAGW